MSRNDEDGAIFLEACVVIPLLMVVMFVFVTVINIFIVQSYVQYGLNQTVNELGSYTYYLNAVGIIDWSNNANQELINQTAQGWKDIDQIKGTAKDIGDTYDTLMDSINGAGEELNDLGNGDINLGELRDLVSGFKCSGQQLDKTKGSIEDSWKTIQGYVKDPAKLIRFLKGQLLVELKQGGHMLIGAFLGKAMMYRYSNDEVLKGLGVVSLDYDGKKTEDQYNAGIDGMSFLYSNFLGGVGSRQIDIIVTYKVKFPVNVSKVLPGITNKPENPLYYNSFMIRQRAAGYGWVNGDGKGEEEYNK